MSENSKKSGNSLILMGCIAPMGLSALLFISLAIWFILSEEQPTPPPYILKNETKVDERVKELDKRIRLMPDNRKYDLDQTVMALYSIEKTLSEVTNFEDLTPFILQRDSDMVAPDVSKLKYKFFNIYKKMIESQDDLEEINSIYKVTTNAITDIAGVVGYDSITGISFDRDQAKQVWQKQLAAADAEAAVKEKLYENQDEMLDLLFDFGKLNSKYIKEWNQLCAMRDRAYLALYERDWDEVISSANSAVKIAPYEKEAHILLVLALLERRKETDASSASIILDEYLKKNQGQQAPGYLLRGVQAMNNEKYNDAILDFDQASAYYPKQQEEITDKLNLYKKRAFLNKSKEGRMIINMYRGIMSGSGFFSPDFQKARIFLKMGEKDKTKKKIFDHFFRRRLQGQWDRVLMDFRFCKNYLKEDFEEVFSGEKLILEIEPAWFQNSLIVSVKNNSMQPVHNITLLLCVRFTDMFIGDYVSFPIGESVAVLKAGEKVQVGRKNISDITKEKIGTEKQWKDIIEYGAILVSDELIAWVAPATPGPIQEDKVPEGEKEKKDDSDSTLEEQTKKVLKEVIDNVIDSIRKDTNTDKDKKTEKNEKQNEEPKK